ncbi:MAG: hypothetical protein AAFR46_19735 [Pseudomonadota bacterium]
MIARALGLTLAALWAAGTASAACPDPAEGGVEFYPSGEFLPANLLRIYIYFPRSMAADQGFQNVRLLDDAGRAVDGVFLENRADLWSPDRRRLTLLLDPGRVKTGLDAHAALGRALVPGQAYAFELSAAAQDDQGCPLGVAGRHSFTVAAADIDPPDPAGWSLTVPMAAGTAPLIVDLGSAHDHLSLAFRLRVLDAAGAIVPGAIALGPDERSWMFTPRAPWAAAPHHLAIDERLEDLAGNRPGLLFDRPVDQAPLPWQSRLSFTPSP